MDAPRHRRPARHPARLALTVVKGASLGTLLSLVVVGGLRTDTPSPDASALSAPPDAYSRVVQRAVAEHGCTSEDVGDRSIPASALIRTSRGTIRQVSFEKGWDVYNGRLPGTLIAVCLDGLHRGRLVSSDRR